MTKYIPVMEILHPQFKGIIYCAPNGTKPPVEYEERFVFFERIHVIKPYECDACLSQICIDLAVKSNIYENSNGYLQIGDDTFILHKSKKFSMQFDKIWIRQIYQKFNLDTRCHNEWEIQQPTNCKKSHWYIWHGDHQINSFKALLNYITQSNDHLYKNCAEILEKHLGNKHVVFYGLSTIDFFYIPIKYVKNYTKLMDIFSKYKVVAEVALPNVITCLDPTGNNTFNAKGINHLRIGKDNHMEENRVNKFPVKYIKIAIETNLTHVHPIKLLGIHKMLNSRNVLYCKMKNVCNIFCNYILPYLFS